MTNTTNRQPPIESVWNKSSFLHVTDKQEISRLEFFAGHLASNGAGGRRASKVASAYAEGRRLRPILYDLFRGGRLPDTMYRDGKISLYGGSTVQGAVVSRVLTFADDPQKNSPIIITVQTGPGKKNAQGAIAPDSSKKDDTVSVSVFMTRHDARVWAGSLLHTINAWAPVGGPREDPYNGAGDDEHDEAGEPQAHRPEQDEGVSAQPEKGSDKMVALYETAGNNGFSLESFYRLLTKHGLTPESDLSEEEYYRLLNIASNAISSVAYGLPPTPKEASIAPTPEMRAMIMAQFGELADLMGEDRDDIRRRIISFATSRRTQSFTDLCKKEVSLLIDALAIELKKKG